MVSYMEFLCRKGRQPGDLRESRAQRATPHRPERPQLFRVSMPVYRYLYRFNYIYMFRVSHRQASVRCLLMNESRFVHNKIMYSPLHKVHTLYTMKYGRRISATKSLPTVSTFSSEQPDHLWLGHSSSPTERFQPLLNVPPEDVFLGEDFPQKK